MSKPAFPRPYSEWKDMFDEVTHQLPQQQGLTDLEYYAGQAMLGLVTNKEDGLEPEKGIAVACFDYAEAMIAESEKRSQQ